MNTYIIVYLIRQLNRVDTASRYDKIPAIYRVAQKNTLLICQILHLPPGQLEPVCLLIRRVDRLKSPY